jgi:Arc/MetJ-type ribon-helix-helix transcriptional regulator
MARARNDLVSVTITISTTPQVRRALERLVATGYYGSNPAAAAERLLARVLEDRIRDGTLKANGVRSRARRNEGRGR